MKKIAICLGMFALSTTIAATAMAETSSFTPFLSISDAQKYCPATTNLVFTPNSPVQYSVGTVSGIFNGVKFANQNPNPATSPKAVDSSGNIQGVQFRDSNGTYGYISGNAITCLYSYPAFNNGMVMLTMRGIAS